MRVLDRYISWLWRLTKIRSRQGLYEFLEEEFRQIPSGARVLSIGAGGEIERLLIEYAGKLQFTATSLDIDPASHPDLVADICDPAAVQGEFDLVVLSEVLEHVTSPQQALNNIHALLKPGGRLILSTPFILPIHAAPRDYFRFTRYGLTLLLGNFRAVRITERNTYFEAIDVLWLRLLQSDQGSARMASMLIIPAIYFLKRPFSLLLGQFVHSDAMTTGYVATAIK